jgi:hypothetical protein
MKVFRSVLAILTGYVLVVVLTTLGFRPFPGGVAPVDGGLVVTVLSMLIAIIAGLVGGYTAAAVATIRPMLSAGIVAVPLLFESIWLLTTRTLQNELLFASAGAVTLIASTIAGGVIREVQLRRTPAT